MQLKKGSLDVTQRLLIEQAVAKKRAINQLRTLIVTSCSDKPINFIKGCGEDMNGVRAQARKANAFGLACFKFENTAAV